MAKTTKGIKAEIEELKLAAEADLYTFACLVNPGRVYGDVHKEFYRWLQYDNGSPNQLGLLPRAHMKSHMIAVWCAWHITNFPETTILYLSATSSLAEAQLYAIKGILTSPVYSRYWPEMVLPEEGKREKWSATEIAVDHPKRKEEAVRDMTIVAAGLTTTTTGKHADVIIADDVVVPDNAYTEEGRSKVRSAMSQMESILNAGGITKAVGTRYHPKDIYDTWKSVMIPDYQENEQGEWEIVGEFPMWSIFERVVEKDNVFLWPRTTRTDGKSFGFDVKVLAKTKSGYLDKTQFWAQYYNDPNDKESNRLGANSFNYYDKQHIEYKGGKWYFKNKPLNVYAAIDFAFSLKKKADYSAICVIGVDADGFIYVLDISRFKTDRISGYYDELKELFLKWEFKKLRAEVTVAQATIVQDLKDSFRKDGLVIRVEEHRPNRHQGNKEERMAAILEPRYDDGTILHYKGGLTPILEEELSLARPAHDDVKDSLASAIEISTPPKNLRERVERGNVLNFNSRFGGVSHS